MNKVSIQIITVAFIFYASFNNLMANEFTSGVGAANYYSGVGVNAGLVRNNSISYISAGCPVIAASSGAGTVPVCGVGVGWISTNIIPNKNNKHALGVYAGILTGSVRFENENSFVTHKYGAGINYTYFFRSINTNGWNVGVFLGMYSDDDKWSSFGAPTLGYQFHY